MHSLPVSGQRQRHQPEGPLDDAGHTLFVGGSGHNSGNSGIFSSSLPHSRHCRLAEDAPASHPKEIHAQVLFCNNTAQPSLCHATRHSFAARG
mmetsp:Transcript_29236/g.62139  ORF Transcript_29236/g.62139 Transcript_29236/m.62139 type:complete len:93 (+) Transcript_29236:555-833(+)